MGAMTRSQLMLFLAEKEMSMRSPRGTDMFFPKLWCVDLTGCTYEMVEQNRPGFCDRCQQGVTSTSTWQMKHFVAWLRRPRFHEEEHVAAAARCASGEDEDAVLAAAAVVAAADPAVAAESCYEHVEASVVSM